MIIVGPNGIGLCINATAATILKLQAEVGVDLSLRTYDAVAINFICCNQYDFCNISLFLSSIVGLSACPGNNDGDDG